MSEQPKQKITPIFVVVSKNKCACVDKPPDLGYHKNIMILTIGEILIDMFKEEGKPPVLCAGGAPFNAAYAALSAGAKTAFVGRVGKDENGKFLAEFARKIPFTELELQVDDNRATTIALVTLQNGERSFRFLRDDTADLFFDAPKEELFQRADVVQLGTLMLSHPFGRAFCSQTARRARAAGKTVAIDVNFRDDIFGSAAEMLNAMAEPVECADIIKFSDDEITLFTGQKDADKAIVAFASAHSDKLLVVTQGKRGSHAVWRGERYFVPSVPAKNVVDTTGAGDAFFGTLLAKIDLSGGWEKLNGEVLSAALAAANRAGAEAVTYKGAIRL